MESVLAHFIETQDDENRRRPKLKFGNIAKAVFCVIFLISIVFGSIYSVDKTENAVILRFGQYHKTAEAGLHLKIPFVDEAKKVVVTTVRRMEIGFKTIETGQEYETIPDEAEMLTADDNIIFVDFVLQYRTADSRKWLFTVTEPEQLLHMLAQSAMRSVVGSSTFDRTATESKAAVQLEARQALELMTKELDFGVEIVAIQLQDAKPPREVSPAFKDVVDAREQRQGFINAANAHANKVIPDARGQAAEMINQAKAYKVGRLANARGDVAQFTELLTEYLKAPETTATRLRFEAQASIMAGSRVIIDPTGQLFKLQQFNQQPK